MDAIYARQSVDKADSLSIQGQIDLCRKQASDNYKVYQDKGYSGKNTNRPDFQLMMDDVEKGLIRKVIVYRLDRFSRSIADFGRLWEILKKHSVEFVSINETFDTSTPMGRAMLNIIMVFAQLERETTAERVRDNYYQRVKSGAWPGGPAPYGFSIGRLPNGDGYPMPALIANEDISVVERIFQTYSQPHETLGSVARSLNSDAIPAPIRPTWDNVTISRVLHNPAYVMANEDIYLYLASKGIQTNTPPRDFDGLHGCIVIGRRDRSAGKYQDTKDQHLALGNHFGIIPAGLWLTCQYKLDENRQIGGSGRGKHTWLSGLMKCAHCGYSIKVNKDGKKYYLVCSGRSNLGLCDCSIRVDLRELESSVAAELERLLARCPDVDPDITSSSELTKALESIDQKIDRLMDALSQSSSMSMTYINRTIQRLEQQRTQLLRHTDTQRKKPLHDLNRLQFQPLEFEQKKVVAAQFIQEIKLSRSSAEVIWTV